MHKLKLFLIFNLIHIYNCCAQLSFYQDCFKGNVVVYGINSNGITIVNLPNQGSSIVKKAFLISGAQNDNIIPNMNYTQNVVINNDTFQLNNNSRRTPWFYAPYLKDGGYVHSIDVSKSITSSTFTIEILSMTNEFPAGENLNNRHYGMSLVVIYENQLKPLMCLNIWLNDKNISKLNQFNLCKTQPINNNKDVGVSISIGHVMGFNPPNFLDGSYVYINGDSIGLIYGPNECYTPNNDPNSNGALLGQFFYDNETLSGICDDTPDSLMYGSDVLANIKSYVSMNDTCLQIGINYQQSNASPYTASSNPIWAIILAYTSHCDTFSVTHTPDTTVCHGAQVPFFATGGQVMSGRRKLD